MIILFLILISRVGFSQEVNLISTLDNSPIYIGGLDSLNSFILRNRTIPKEEAFIDGTLLLSIKVDTCGKVSELKIIRGLGNLIDHDITKVINSMPNWDPAKLKGIKVESIVYLAIKYNH
jgi:protein TonB